MCLYTQENSITACGWSCRAWLHFPTLPLVGWSPYIFRSQVTKAAALLQLAHLFTVGESQLIMMLKRLHLHSLILSPNSVNIMETSGFAAIGFTVWANSCPQTHTFKNKQLDISTNSFDSLDFLLRKYNSQSFKDMGFYDTEIRVKAKKNKWLEITFLV